MNKHIEQLKGIAEDMGMTFLYEAYPQLNVLLDKVKRDRTSGNVTMPNATFPVCICLLPVGGAFDIHNTTDNLKDRQNCIFAFGEPMPLDFTGEQAGEISERLKGLAAEFITRINATGDYEGIYGQLPYQIGYDRLDACLCLVTVEFTLAPIYGECINIAD